MEVLASNRNSATSRKPLSYTTRRFFQPISKATLNAAIMATPELSARLRYLNDTAHLLAATAPETSRYLMSQHNSLLFDSNVELPEAQNDNACGACGSIMILGWNGSLEFKQLGRKNIGVSTPRRRNAVYTCDSCGRKTRRYMPEPRQKVSSESKSAEATPVSATSSSGPPQKEKAPALAQPASSNSKKRAKTRKQGSLQAILDKQKASQGASGSGFGLDLMDFMKNAPGNG